MKGDSSGKLDIQFGCQIVRYGDVEETVDLSLRAEKCGFDTISFPDHLFHPVGTEEFLTEPPWEVFTVLGAVASKTENVDLLPGVADSVRRHPALLAHSIATLDRLSNGRSILGIGAGEAFNLAPVKDFDWEKPYTRFKEFLSVVTGLWESQEEEPFSFEGEYFTLEDAYMGLKPVRDPYPPIYVGCYGSQMKELTGKVADGWIPWIYTPEQYEKDLEPILRSAEKHGRNPDEIVRSVMIPTSVSPDSNSARKMAIDRSRVNLALRPPLLREMGYSELAEETPEMWKMAYSPKQREKLREVAGKIPDSEVEKIIIAGSPGSAIEQIEEFLEAGVNRLILIPVGNSEVTMESYRDKILPYFREEI